MPPPRCTPLPLPLPPANGIPLPPWTFRSPPMPKATSWPWISIGPPAGLSSKSWFLLCPAERAMAAPSLEVAVPAAMCKTPGSMAPADVEMFTFPEKPDAPCPVLRVMRPARGPSVTLDEAIRTLPLRLGLWPARMRPSPWLASVKLGSTASLLPTARKTSPPRPWTRSLARLPPALKMTAPASSISELPLRTTTRPAPVVPDPPATVTFPANWEPVPKLRRIPPPAAPSPAFMVSHPPLMASSPCPAVMLMHPDNASPRPVPRVMLPGLTAVPLVINTSPEAIVDEVPVSIVSRPLIELSAVSTATSPWPPD